MRMAAGLFLSVILILACRAPEQPSALLNLEAVPQPRLDRLEAVMRERISQQREELDAGLENAAVDLLPSLYSELGKLYLAVELRSAAAVCFRNALRFEPEEVGWTYLLGVTLQLEGRFEEAAEQFEAAIELEPSDLPSHLRLARVELDRGRGPSALDHYRRALRLDPSSAAAQYGSGRLALMQGDTKLAVELLSKAVVSQPDAGAARHQLGLAYRELGEMDAAAAQLERSGSKSPTFDDPRVQAVAELVTGPKVFLARGSRAERSGDLQQAIVFFRRAVALDANSAEAHHSLGSALGMANDHEGALEHLQRAAEADPRLPGVHFNLASALSRVGNLDGALHAFDRAIELDPANREARVRRIRVLDAVGRLDEALAAADQEASVGGENADLELVRGRLFSKLGRAGKAIASFEAAIRLAPDRAAGYLELARAKVFANDYPAALETLELGLQRMAREPSLRSFLAQLLATAPDPDVHDGERSLRLASDLFADHQSLEHGELVALAMSAAGQHRKAIEWQRGLIQQAEAAAVAPEVVGRLNQNLESYVKASQ